MNFLTFLLFAASAIALPTFDFDEYSGDATVEIDQPFASCGTPNDIFTLNDVTLTPNPPAAGKLLTVNAHGVTTAPIQKGAVVEVTAKLGPITGIQKTMDLCSYAVEEGFPCPIAAGNQTIKVAVDIPGNVPKLTYNIKAVAKNPNGQAIFCLQGKLKIVFRSDDEY